MPNGLRHRKEDLRCSIKHCSFSGAVLWDKNCLANNFSRFWKWLQWRKHFIKIIFLPDSSGLFKSPWVKIYYFIKTWTRHFLTAVFKHSFSSVSNDTQNRINVGHSYSYKSNQLHSALFIVQCWHLAYFLKFLSLSPLEFGKKNGNFIFLAL